MRLPARTFVWLLLVLSTLVPAVAFPAEQAILSQRDIFHPVIAEHGMVASQEALADAELNPEDIDYINAHGTSTQLNDKLETRAIKTVFGDHAKELPISSTKSMTGHLLGAAGGVELIVCILSLKNGLVHATANYEKPDPECDLDYVPGQAREKRVRTAISNSFGFGGHNAVLVAKEFS